MGDFLGGEVGGRLGLQHFFVTDGEKRDYLSRALQRAGGATKNPAHVFLWPTFIARGAYETSHYMACFWSAHACWPVCRSW